MIVHMTFDIEVNQEDRLTGLTDDERELIDNTVESALNAINCTVLSSDAYGSFKNIDAYRDRHWNGCDYD